MLAYLDCFSGISGDMLLGALLHAGLELDELRAGLATLPLSGYTLEAERVSDHGLSGVRCVVRVEEPDPHEHRHLREIRDILAAGRLPERARERALAIFTRLAEAEGAIHGVSPEEVGFHEVGAVDSIVDIVGTALGFELLGIEEIYCSELPLTSGRVRSSHGPLPVPAPATLELLKDSGVVWKTVPGEGELVTPTGAAVIAALAQFGWPERMTIQRVGYGFGQKKLPWANCLRLLLGERTNVADAERDEIVVLASNIDNMTGEALGWLMDRLLSAGALDVSYTPLQMKKNRPGRPVDRPRIHRRRRTTIQPDPARECDAGRADVAYGAAQSGSARGDHRDPAGRGPRKVEAVGRARRRRHSRIRRLPRAGGAPRPAAGGRRRARDLRRPRPFRPGDASPHIH